jgi:ADP-heptose:LPS heptosyltransferase
MTARAERILVIRLGAFGDLVQSFGPFAAIRAHHPAAQITLLTTVPHAPWLRQAPWFDQISIDTRPSFWNLVGMARLMRKLRGYDMVYDLQTSGRSTRYFWLAGRPHWSGIGVLRSHRHRDPDRDHQHTQDRQRGQLRDAGIRDVPRPDLSWLMQGPAPRIAGPFALLVPGASPTRPEKRWPEHSFASLARQIAQRGLTPVLAGGASEKALAARISAACPKAVNLAGQTDVAALAALAARARVAVGNDTGPMHLAAAVGCRCIVLFGPGSDPALTAPRAPDGTWATIIESPNLADLPPESVAAALP